MGYFKRAVTSITRRMGKTIILLLLVFILGNVIAGAVSISQSVKNTENAITQGMIPVATLEVDWDRYQSDVTYDDEGKPDVPYPQLNVEQIERLGELTGVEYYDYANSYWGMSKELIKYYPDDYEDVIKYPPPNPDDEYYQEYFYLTGGQTADFMDLKMGLIELVEGRTLSEEDISGAVPAVLISEQMAQANNLTVGSTFTLFNEIYSYETYDYEIKESVGYSDYEYREPSPPKNIENEYTVIGIYKTIIPPSTSTNINDKMNEMYQKVERINKIYSSNQTIKKLNTAYLTEDYNANPANYPDGLEAAINQGNFTPYYIFKNTNDVDGFKAQYKDVLNSEYFKLTTNRSDFKKAIVPLQNMSSISDIVLYMGVGASLIILSLLITLFLRDRRGEIGIYLALGERKRKIIVQVLSEVLIVAVLGITMALFSGNIISKELSDSMMENQIIAKQKEELQQEENGYSYQNNPLTYMGYSNEITLEEMAEQYNVSLDINIILMFYLLGVLTVLLSTLIPIIYVLGLNPKKILM